MAKLDQVGPLERARDLATSYKREPLDALKVCVLDSEDALIREEGFRVVVDELPVDENVDTVCGDGLHF